MDRKDVLYPHHQKRLESRMKKLSKCKTKKINKQYLEDFLNKIKADGTGKAQMISYLDRLIPIFELVGKKNLKSLTKRDMEAIFSKYRERGLSTSSLNKTIECIKAFYRWLFDKDAQDSAPDSVRWLRRETVKNTIRAEELWTEDDMEKVMKSARSLRDKCIFSILFEAGLRPGELRGLKIKDVIVNGNMIRLYVSGKTSRIGGERVVPVLRSYSILRMWLSQYPKSNNPESWLWTTNGKPLKDNSLRFMFRTTAEKAGINKPKNPYILRHTALTRFYKKLPGIMASKLAGHAPNSRESQTYTHLAAEDIEDAILHMNGISNRKVVENEKCGKCGNILGVGERICEKCGLIKNNEDAMKDIEYTENARNFMYGLEHLSKDNEELRELKQKMEKLVNSILVEPKKS